MKKKVSYFIDLGSLSYDRYIYFKTIKDLNNGIKKLIDTKQSFLVYVNYTFDSDYYADEDVYFEIWQYDHNEDQCWRFNLRENIYLKHLLWCTKRLKRTMLSYGR